MKNPLSLACLPIWVAMILSSGPACPASGEPDSLSSKSPLLKYEFPKSLSGSIYRQVSGTNELLFRFNRASNRAGSTLRVTREFTYPDGKPAVRERVVYEANRLASCELEELQIGAAGTATVARATGGQAKPTVEFHYLKSAGARVKSATETWTESMLNTDMAGSFLSVHFDQLARGEKVKCRMLVIPRRETVGFTLVKDSEAEWQGRGAISVRMEPSSPFVSVMIDPLVFTIEKVPPHRVMKYVGRTTPKVQVDGKWKDLDAVTVFDWDSAH